MQLGWLWSFGWESTGGNPFPENNEQEGTTLTVLQQFGTQLCILTTQKKTPKLKDIIT